MHHTRVDGHLNVELDRDFNLFTARYLERLAETATSVTVDLRAVRLVDTEGIIALDRIQRAGKDVTVRNPPDIFFDVLRALDLPGLFNVHADAT
jgi:anti-anti-sigma regulatory factor